MVPAFISAICVLSIRWLALLTTVLGTPRSAAAQLLVGDSIIISGVVKKPNGAPASKRRVILGATGVHIDTELQTITNSKGYFQFVVPSDSLQPYPQLSCLYIPKLGWNFQTAVVDVESTVKERGTYVLQLKKRAKMVRWWAIHHPPY